MWTQRFRVDGLNYEFQVRPGNRVVILLTGGANPAWRPPYDPFARWGDDSAAITADTIGVTRYPLTVVRTALRHLHAWLGSQRPKSFEYSWQSADRTSLYRRVAQQLAERFGYQWVEYAATIYFYRVPLQPAECSSVGEATS